MRYTPNNFGCTFGLFGEDVNVKKNSRPSKILFRPLKYYILQILLCYFHIRYGTRTRILSQMHNAEITKQYV